MHSLIHFRESWDLVCGGMGWVCVLANSCWGKDFGQVPAAYMHAYLVHYSPGMVLECGGELLLHLESLQAPFFEP